MVGSLSKKRFPSRRVGACPKKKSTRGKYAVRDTRSGFGRLLDATAPTELFALAEGRGEAAEKVPGEEGTFWHSGGWGGGVGCR